jgi:hypothetical protein
VISLLPAKVRSLRQQQTRVICATEVHFLGMESVRNKRKQRTPGTCERRAVSEHAPPPIRPHLGGDGLLTNWGTN